MRLKFFSHLILIVLLNLLIKPLAIFGIDAEVQNVVGAENYGLYFSLLNFTYLFNIFLDLGITNYNVKYIAHHPHLAKSYIGKILPLRLLLFLIYVAITLTSSYFLGYNEKQFYFLFFLIINQFLISVLLFFRSYFAGLLLLKLDILLSVLDKFLLIFLMGYFLYFQVNIDISIDLFIWMQSLSLGITCFIAFILILSKIGLPKIKWNLSFNKLIIKKSFPYALLIILMSLYNRVDSVMLERMLPSSFQAGIYAQAFRLLDAFFMFAMLFSTLLFPIFSKMLKKKENVLKLLESASLQLFSLAITLAFICFFNATFIMDLLYKNDIVLSSIVFKYLIICFVPLCVTLIFGTLLTANGNLSFLNKISFIGILVNMLLNYFLIPKHGALGATFTSLATQSLVALIYIAHTFKLFKVKIKLEQIIKYLGFIISLVLSSLLFEQVTNSYLKILFVASISLTYLLLTNMLQWRLLLELLNKKGK
jgi:O-antigen/teichoic acid export membrane protein